MNEMLWFTRPNKERGINGYRLRRDGVWEYCHWGDNEWEEIASGHPIYDELARRLLAERAEQERLDEHNDQAETEPFYAIVKRVNAHSEQLNVVDSVFAPEVRGRLSTLEAAYDRLGKVEMRYAELVRRIAELDKNLAREIEQRTLETKESRRNQAVYERVQADLIAKVEGLEASKAPRGPDRPGRAAASEPPPALSWNRTQGIMVDANDQIVLDLSDYFEDGKMSPKDHDLLEKLADLWCAWGAEGYLRDLLDQTRFSPVYMGTPGFRQLRSELLAKPWKEGV